MKNLECILDKNGRQNSSAEESRPAENLELISLNQLLTGMFAVLADRGIKSVSIRGQSLDGVMVKAGEELQEIATAEGLEPTFQLRSGLYGTSQELREALQAAVQRGVITVDFIGQAIRLCARDLRPESLHRYPGNMETYQRFAAAFLNACGEDDSLSKQN